MKRRRVVTGLDDADDEPAMAAAIRARRPTRKVAQGDEEKEGYMNWKVGPLRSLALPRTDQAESSSRREGMSICAMKGRRVTAFMH